MSEDLRQRHRDQGLAVITWDRLLFNRWYGPPDVERVRSLWKIQAEFSAELGEARHAVVSLFEASAGIRVSDEARREASRLAQAMAPNMICLAQVVAGEGFFSAIVRSVVSGVVLVSRSTVPSSVFDRLDAAADWVAGRWPPEQGGHDAPRLRAILAECEQRSAPGPDQA